MRNRKYNSNIAFLDTFMLTLVGITSILAIVILLINPVADRGKIDPITEFMITLTWDDKQDSDMDIWVRGPDGTVVGWNKAKREAGYIILDRDDLGNSNDYTIVDGIRKPIHRNLETITINSVVPGEYFITVHHYGKRPGVIAKVQVDMMDMHPFKLFLSREVEIAYKDEATIASFIVNDEGNVTDIRTDINVILYEPTPGTHIQNQ